MRNAPSVDDQLEMFRKMVVVRHMEETLGELHKAGKTRGPIHRCDGQEAVGVGATAMLADTDYITSTHRGHAHYIGKGLDPYRVVAEILGRETGYCEGRAGHMIVADAAKGMIGGNAIVGAGIPAATGMACSIRLTGRDAVAMCLFGDGAAQTGICHESMNIASLWKLPVIFLLEHNQYGLTVHSSRQSSVEDLSVRAEGYGMPGVLIDGNDAVAVYGAVAEAVARAKRGEGPTLIEAKTYRFDGFSTSDMGGYQPDGEIAEWRARDPIPRLRAALEGHIGEERLSAVEAEAHKEVDDAFAQALADPLPGFAGHPASRPYSEVS
ncbi:thiamine pyrophosphate-dependent dehydrogenase E1 component subunit alpha [Kaustia mangrovi]|uniref:Thiamine pyrophosphate-dependent dehydrogenase E1 component subunit alpha n=1 Tax=Kaustia mangrovi TaxID=2593653 RepID=A0A7S8C3V4_9HYPH|nr:thiamine pyrophosphate-dependent dehydrogenase E1 component subunit alpha [Kaustia mangrovi]QPC42910.1 thiamine pyrophosphate-dependent dehydrogenase E1 component subunit alpha [Kaustia mangrovi]